MSYYSWEKRPPREFRGKPQWTLDEMYISPFTARRRYDEEGVMHYDAVERNTAPTGVEVMDHYLRRLSEGINPPKFAFSPKLNFLPCKRLCRLPRFSPDCLYFRLKCVNLPKSLLCYKLFS